MCDVIFCNRYYAWYHDYGQTQLISKQLERELRDWFDAHGKPVVQAEYGADTVAGMHVVRAYIIDVISFQLKKTTQAYKVQAQETANISFSCACVYACAFACVAHGLHVCAHA